MQNLIKYTLLFLALMLCNAVLRAQQDRVYLPWDLSKTAGFPGGPVEFYKYFRTTQIYPADTSIRPAGNRLILSFVVEPDGSASDFRVFETPGPDFTEAVSRALDAVRWNSAEANGHSVRQMMILYFFFHHDLRNVEVREGGLDIWNYSTLSDLAQEDYKNINFPSQPVFMGYYPEDSLASKKQYPEAARAAGAQGDVVVGFTVQPDGRLTDIELKHDIGYGCGAEILRLMGMKQAWIPAQAFDSVYAHRLERTYPFCPDPNVFKTSDKVYEEGELHYPQSRFYSNVLAEDKPALYSARGILGPDTDSLDFDGSVVEVSFIMGKDKTAGEIAIIRSPSEKHSAMAKKFLEQFQCNPPSICNQPCRMRFRRYLCFRQGAPYLIRYRENQIILTKEDPLKNPGILPPANYDTLYGPTEVDSPAIYKTGQRSIAEHLLLRWPNYKTEIPEGEILVRVDIWEDGNTRNTTLVQGIGAPFDEKALQVLGWLGFWEPAYKNGHPVRSWQVVRVGNRH